MLANTIKEMMATDPETDTMTTEGIFGFLTRSESAVTKPALLSSVSGLISAASGGDKAALDRKALGLVSAVIPVIVGTPAPAAPVVPTPVFAPIAVSPIFATAAPASPAVAEVPSTAAIPAAATAATSIAS